MAGAAAGFDTMQALFDNKKAPQNSALESTWSSQPELPPVVEDLQVTATVGKYAISRKLGEGEFAAVFECARTAEPRGTKFALKAILKERVQRHSSLVKAKRNIVRVNTEVRAMKKFSHGGVCRLYDVVQSPCYIYLVLEIGDKDLYSFLDDYPSGCDEDVIRSVMRITALGLRHCHNAPRGVVCLSPRVEGWPLAVNPEGSRPAVASRAAASSRIAPRDGFQSRGTPAARRPARRRASRTATSSPRTS